MRIVVPDLCRDAFHRFVRGIEQPARVLHFQVDEMLDWRMAGQLFEAADEMEFRQIGRARQIVEIEFAVEAAVHQLLDVVEVDARPAAAGL